MERKIKFSVELLFYNTLKELQRSLPTYIDYVDEIIAVDGRHKTTREFNKLSIDGSREYLKSFGNKVSLIDKPNEYEVEKRKMVKNVCKNDNLIIIDSDSYIVGDWNKFFEYYERMKQRDTGRINLYKLKLQRSDCLAAYVDFPLVYYKPWEFTYYKNKHAIPIKKSRTDEPNIYAPTSFHITIPGITVMHDHSLSTEQRSSVRTDHRYFLSRFENTN